MTFANRRRLIHLLWALVSNGAFPFLLGSAFTLIVTAHSLLDTAQAMDKSGLSVCVVKGDKQ